VAVTVEALALVLAASLWTRERGPGALVDYPHARDGH
jgi:hypothetical protein